IVELLFGTRPCGNPPAATADLDRMSSTRRCACVGPGGTGGVPRAGALSVEPARDSRPNRSQRSRPHEQPEMLARRDRRFDLARGSAHASLGGEYLLGRNDIIIARGQQEQ